MSVMCISQVTLAMQYGSNDVSKVSGDDAEAIFDTSKSASGSMYTVSGVVGGRVQFDKSTGTVIWFESGVTEIDLPEKIDGVTVTKIGEWATSYNNNIIKIILPSTIQSIGDGFGRNSQIEELVIPGSVKDVDYCSFMNCSMLSTVTIESGVTEVGGNCFENCSLLNVLSMPTTLTKIGDYAFRNCTSLEVATWGDELFYPFDGAFDDKIELGEYCFSGCPLGRLDFSDSFKSGLYYQLLHQVTPTGDYLNDLFNIAQSQLGYHEGNSLDDMSGSSTGDDDYTEYNYWWNEPGTMWCGEYVGWCIAMAGIPYEIAHPKYTMMNSDGSKRNFAWSDTTFAGGTYLLKKGDVILFKYNGGNHIVLVESASQFGDIVTIETLNGNHNDNVSCDSYMINASTGKTVGIWESVDGYVDNIYSPDFSIANNLTYYTVTFNTQGGSAAWDTKRVTNNASYGLMPLPTRDGYTFDGWYTAASGGSKVSAYKKVSLSGNQTLYAHWKSNSGDDSTPSDIDYDDEDIPIDTSGWGFDKTTGTITSIPTDWTGGMIPSKIDGVTVTSIGTWAANAHQSITDIIVPSTVKRIERGAFYNCEYLKSVTLREGLQYIGNMAFYSCDRLEKVNIPASVKTIGEDYGNVFYSCYSLSDVTFAGDVSQISFGRFTFTHTLFLRPDFSTPYKRSTYYDKLMNIVPTGDYVADAITIAASQDGYHEGNSYEEMDGSNEKGYEDYAEMAYFTGSPSYHWWQYEEEYNYGGWCGNYCNWCLSMTSIPAEIHGWWAMSQDEYPTWSDTVYAGGSYTIKAGDVLHMNAGHYCLVTDVKQEGARVIIGTWNGNHSNNVVFDTNELRASDGYNLSAQESGGGNAGERYTVYEIIPYLPDKASDVTFYNVTFNGNGGNVPATQPSKKLAASSYYGLMPTPTRAGYYFDGWYTAPQGGTRITSYRKTLLENDITLYAHWTGVGGDMYRLYNPNSGEHFYTSNAEECMILSGIGWNYEGVGWILPDSGEAVYRLYNPNSGTHHYTKDKTESDYLDAIGWNYEGVGWYSATQMNVPLYRLYNPNSGEHHYTKDITERDFLDNAGWNYEGISWYGL